MTLNLIEQIAAAFIGLALLLALVRMLIGPSPADRVISADTLSVSTAAALTAVAAYFNNEFFLDVALVYAAVAFIGVIAISSSPPDINALPTRSSPRRIGSPLTNVL